MKTAPATHMEFYYGNKYALKQKFLEYFKDIGVIAPAARLAGISRSTINRWLRNDDGFVLKTFEAAQYAVQAKGNLIRQIPAHKRNDFIRDALSCDEGTAL